MPARRASPRTPLEECGEAAGLGEGRSGEQGGNRGEQRAAGNHEAVCGMVAGRVAIGKGPADRAIAFGIRPGCLVPGSSGLCQCKLLQRK